MRKAEKRAAHAGQFEVHCSICGAELGFFEKGAKGEDVRCFRCKRNLSFIVQDGVTIVQCKHAKG